MKFDRRISRRSFLAAAGVTCGSRDWTSVSSMMFRVPPCAVPAAEDAVEPAAEEAATELEEPPQAVRASAAVVTPAADRKLRREIRRSNFISIFSPLLTASGLYPAKAARSENTQGPPFPLWNFALPCALAALYIGLLRKKSLFSKFVFRKSTFLRFVQHFAEESAYFLYKFYP